MDEENVLIEAPSGKKYNFSDFFEITNANLDTYTEYASLYVSADLFLEDTDKAIEGIRNGQLLYKSGGFQWVGENLGTLNPLTVRFLKKSYTRLMQKATPVEDIKTAYTTHTFGLTLNKHYNFNNAADYANWKKGGVYGNELGKILAAFIKNKFIPTLPTYDFTGSLFQNSEEAKQKWIDAANALETAENGNNNGTIDKRDIELFRLLAGPDVAQFLNYIEGNVPKLKSLFESNRESQIALLMDQYGFTPEEAALHVDADIALKRNQLSALLQDKKKSIEIRNHINTWDAEYDPFEVKLLPGYTIDGTIDNKTLEQALSFLLGGFDKRNRKSLELYDLLNILTPEQRNNVLQTALLKLKGVLNLTPTFIKTTSGLYIYKPSIDPVTGTAHAFDPTRDSIIRISATEFPDDKDINKLFVDSVRKYLRHRNPKITTNRHGNKLQALRKYQDGGYVGDIMKSIEKMQEDQLKEKADALNIAPETLKLKQESAGDNPLWGDTWQENLRALSTGLDAASAVGSFIPVVGPLIGGIGGSIATAGNWVADGFDPTVTRDEMYKNLALNAGLTAASLLPGLGVAKLSKVAKVGKGLSTAQKAAKLGLKGTDYSIRYGLPIATTAYVASLSGRISELLEKRNKGTLTNDEARELHGYGQALFGSMSGIGSNAAQKVYQHTPIFHGKLRALNRDAETSHLEPGTFVRFNDQNHKVPDITGSGNDRNIEYNRFVDFEKNKSIRTFFNDIRRDNIVLNSGTNDIDFTLNYKGNDLNFSIPGTIVKKINDREMDFDQFNALFHKPRTFYKTLGEDPIFDNVENLRLLASMYDDKGLLKGSYLNYHRFPRTKDGLIVGILRKIFPNDRSSDKQLLDEFNKLHSAHKDLDFINLLQLIRDKVDYNTHKTLESYMYDSPDILANNKGGKLDLLRELRKTNFTTDNSSSSIELSTLRNGGILKFQNGGDVPEENLWWFDIWEDKTSLLDWNPTLDKSHAGNLSNNKWHSKANNLNTAWKLNNLYTQNKANITNDLQSAYNTWSQLHPNLSIDDFTKWYNEQINSINDRFKTPISNGLTGAKKGNEAHRTLYPSLYTGDDALGYNEDLLDIYGSTTWNRRGDLYKTDYDELNEEEKANRTHTLTIGNTSYSVAKLANGHIKFLPTSDTEDVNTTDENPIMTGELPDPLKGKETNESEVKNPTESNYNPLWLGLHSAYPDFLDISRYLKNLRNNLKILELGLKKDIALKRPVLRKSFTYGDFGSQTYFLKLADKYRSKADDAASLTNNAEAAAAILFEGEMKALLQEALGKLLDNAAIQKSILESRAVADAVDSKNREIAELNDATFVAKDNYDIDLKQAKESADTTNFNTLTMAKELRARTESLKAQEMALKIRLLELQDAYTQFVTDTPRIQLLKLLRAVATSADDRLRLTTQIELEMLANERRYRLYFSEARLRALTGDFRKVELPVIKKEEYPEPEFKKKGGKITTARIKRTAEDLKELRKLIRHGIITNQKVLDNLSKATLLELKKMMGI